MISEDRIRRVIEEVIGSLEQGEKTQPQQSPVQSDDSLVDITAVDMKRELLVPEPNNGDMYLKLKEKTPARVGIWRSGPRPLTRALLRFRADHAVAQDAVFNDVAEGFAKSLGMETIQTCCRDKDEFLTRPDLGRKLDEEQAKKLREICQASPKVQIFIADGLSSTAVEVNAMDAFKSIAQGLKAKGIEVGTPFFLRFGRVPAMDVVSEILTPEVTVLLIGERPGLATGESMSCYMAYQASTTMAEAKRTVISNIHQGGTPTVEAGAHIAEVISQILKQKASGIDLKL